MKNMTFEEKMEMYNQAQKNVKKAQKSELEKIKNSDEIKRAILKILDKNDFINPEWHLAENPNIIEFRDGNNRCGIISTKSLFGLVEEYFKNFDSKKFQKGFLINYFHH